MMFECVGFTFDEVVEFAVERGYSAEDVEVLTPDESAEDCFEVFFGCEFECFTWLFRSLDERSFSYEEDVAED